MKKLGKKIICMLVVVIILASFVGSAFAQNSLSWNQDGKRCTINLYTGDFSITCYDNAGNAFTIYGPQYDFDLSISKGRVIYKNSGQVEWVGDTHVIYKNSGQVEWVGNVHIFYNSSGKVSSISGNVR